ncbi:MAG: biopolymer transporter ExbD [Deltaproteobacteria bacterium]|nr:biopolymer transporter ExbD [Deltaproteobacteria bacterium]
MAMQRGRNDELQAEINITPLVDVVLVLLVIFMVVTPLLKQEIPLELPSSDNSRSAQDLAQLTLTLASDGGVFLNGQPLMRDTLVTQLQAIYAARTEKTIFLEADRHLSYGDVVSVMDDCKAAGVTAIGVITKKEQSSAPQQQ